MMQPPPEKMGSFYLGAKYNMVDQKIEEETINYDARDLTTHAVCVGMTGSGKTGLCIDLLEEAALDQVPAIIVDPKGDMTNLLLQFEELSPASFVPWINADDAARKGLSIDAYADATAQKWQEGLASWGQGKERIKALKKSVKYTIFTPGSDAGVPINILGSFAAPLVDFDTEAEMLRERIQGTVSALLGMINVKADPSRSREGILLATIFEHHWRKGEGLDLATIIMAIQKPPVQKLGVFDVDTFFPEQDRFDLAMQFNTLVASPQFANWLKGEPLDIDKLYFTADGKARHSIFYLAHLSDSERMFFVTLLLNSLVTWMRKQTGTTSLRSLLYFDEVFGYFPPVAQPPSKKPLLTILKQARTFGLGAILVTQNPGDLDYKGLSNAGTWFIGKLQTDRDRDKVLQGLSGAINEAGAGTSMDFSSKLAGLSSRVFLMHNVHEDQPVIFHTRWAMSFLRGPLTRAQIRTMTADSKVNVPTTDALVEVMTESQTKAPKSATPPALDPGIDQRFLRRPEVESNTSLVYHPKVLGVGKVRFYDGRKDIDLDRSLALLANPPDDFGRVDWSRAEYLDDWQRKLSSDPYQGPVASYSEVPKTLTSAKEMKQVSNDFADWLYHEQGFEIAEQEKLKLHQKPDETLEAFQMRVNLAMREARDKELDALQDKYEVKMDRLEERLRKKELKQAEQQADLSQRKTAEWVGVAETIFSVFSGRRRSLNTATTKMRMRRKASHQLEATQADIDVLMEAQDELREELDEKLGEIGDQWQSIANDIGKEEIKPRRADVKVDAVYLVWKPA
ncbi:MAG: type IV secretion system DNA-binding domain-containing protein [Saprospiraceae bacterium]|nr:type IV secretion system DNA-binding domain-containing protein [Saprospiraceae bacterium]